MFRRKQDDEDPFAALKEAAERGSSRISGGASTGASASGASGSADGGERRTEPRPLTLGDEQLRVPGAPRSRRGSDVLLVLLFVLLALGGAGALVWQSERDADDAAIASSDDSPGSGATAGDDEDERDADDAGARDPDAPRRVDLVRPAAFRAALRRIRAELRPGERVWMLRVTHDRIGSYTALRNGDQRMVDVADDLSVSVREAGRAGSYTPLPLTRIAPAAPSRAIRGAVARGGMPASRFDYMVMLGPPPVFREAPDWSLFFRDVARRNYHWNAPLSGAPVTRPGESATTRGSGSTTTRTSSSSSLTITRDGRTTTLTGADAQRITACVRRAGTDGAAIQRCLP